MIVFIKFVFFNNCYTCTNFAGLFAIIKLELPPNFLAQNEPSCSTRNADVLQAEEHEASNEDEFKEPMDVDDNNNIV